MLLRMINHLEPLDWGEITMDGRHVGDQRTPAAACGPPVISPGRARKPVSAWGFGGDRFTAGDLTMTTVLRITDGKGLLDRYLNLVAYVFRSASCPTGLAGDVPSPSSIMRTKSQKNVKANGA
jgi:hypothetical protein